MTPGQQPIWTYCCSVRYSHTSCALTSTERQLEGFGRVSVPR
ncbi:MAG: hypothetical protein KYX61_02170 [Gammaproteobacteria bacterium]|nr:hypothetical protein [Gammaproteobacteria bacterium]